MTRLLEPSHARAFRFACEVISLYTKLASNPDVPAHLARQVLRAGTSIGANLEEAKGAQTRRELTAKFSIALTDARETAYWLRLFDATTLAAPTLVQPLLADADELIAVMTVARHKLDDDVDSGSPEPNQNRRG